MVSDPICQQCMDLFQKEQRQSKESSGAGGLCATAYMRLGVELSYQRKAEKTLADENCFKIYIVSLSLSLPHSPRVCVCVCSNANLSSLHFVSIFITVQKRL